VVLYTLAGNVVRQYICHFHPPNHRFVCQFPAAYDGFFWAQAQLEHIRYAWGEEAAASSLHWPKSGARRTWSHRKKANKNGTENEVSYF
jgi:hypothetical protein